ncbi:hypothetical protein SAMN02910384_02233 [Pseudobutyrivibrio sp. ACV-2]|uniref:hypothetical protein n=1 Tax=Pseudobutyrivibrio sp. ACV-2 TaxID=1520801 RepID=UPI0008958426|nr:hypothetical protein [Pseudobutyrivibrio sp. ACV-2]SEA74038.1 hypothetical protein SAMN02910384_02233 [Pseudobutyrivibrio sp. ACV-2]
MRKVKSLFTAVLSFCLIVGVVATSTITSEAKGKKSAKEANVVATSTVNDPALFALMVKGDTFTYNGKEYSSSQIGRMNLEQAAGLLGLTVSKSKNDGSIEDPHGAWAEENRAQFDLTFADSADGRIHIQRFIDLRGSQPTRTLFSYDGSGFEMDIPNLCSGFNYDSAST